MQIRIIAVGRIKEKYLNQAIAEYTKRLSRYCKLEIAEVPDEKTPDGASEALEEQIKEREGQRILKQIRDQDYVIALALDGQTPDSPQLAAKLDRLGVSGHGKLTFLIGGSLGLHQSVLSRANEKLSFSNLTFPHQLMRIFLLEQIYRCYRINLNEPYHK